MAAPKGGSDSGNTAVIVMIIFIVLFLISSTLAIIFYVNLETANRTASEADAKMARLGTPSQISSVEQLAESSGLSSGSVYDKLDAVVKFFSESVVGTDAVNYNISTAKSIAYARIESLWDQIALAQDKDIQTVKAAGLAGAVENLLALLNEKSSELTSYDEQATAALLASETALEKSAKQIAELQSELESLGQTVASMKEQTNSNITAIQDRFDSNVNSIKKERDLIISTTEKRLEQIDAELKEAAQLRERLGELEDFRKNTRLKPTLEAEALDPDGTIISVDSREQMVYINLAAKDKIYRGLTFSIYDGLDKTVPVSGQGKATIEVVEILDNVSRCKVVDNQSNAPIVKGDIIANLVWDAKKQYVFCVVGDFDFNMDGQIDADGASRIGTLITGWDGKIEDLVNVDTDFLVFGSRPVEDDDKKEVYDKALDEGVRLGVPAFNTSRFFRFIGYSKKQVIN